MRTLLLAGLLLALPTAAAARPVLALRLGYAVADGNAAKDITMSEVAKSEVPIQLDAMWKFPPHFSLGLYFSYGFGQLGGQASDECDAAGASCSVSTMRLGGLATYEFQDAWWRLSPWIGAGLGYEWVREKATLGGRSGTQDLSGWEYFNVEVGGDVKVAPKVAVGPYVSFRLGRYSSLDGYGIANKGYHDWLGFGVRGKYDL